MSLIATRLETQLVPEAAYIGQTVVYRIEIDRPDDVAVRLPDNVDVSPYSLNGFSQRQEELGAGTVREILELEIGVYTLDEAEIPAITLLAVTPDGVVDIPLPPMELELLSLVAEEGETPREMAPPDTVWVPDYGLLQAAGVALAVFLLVLLLWRLIAGLRGRPKKAKRAPPPPPPRPADEVALEELEALRAEDLVARGERKLYFFRLSEIVRVYVGARFGFDSLELTTTELVITLRDRPTPGLDLDRFGAWCGLCDLVKFARYEPDDTECSSSLDSAYAFVEETRESNRATDAGKPVAAGGRA